MAFTGGNPLFDIIVIILRSLQMIEILLYLIGILIYLSHTLTASNNDPSSPTVEDSIPGSFSNEESNEEEPYQNTTPGDPPIHSLPTELIQQIATYLSPECTASFALSSKRLLSTIGTRALQLEGLSFFLLPNGRGIETGGSRFSFLQLLQRDLPDHLLCHHCRSFHRPLGRYYDPKHRPKPACFHRNGAFYRGVWGFRLPFTDAQQVMNRFRYGPPHGMPLEEINYELSATTTEYHMRAPAADGSGSFWPGEGTIECHEKVETRILDGELHLDTQAVFVIQRGSSFLAEFVVNERCPNHGLDALRDLDEMRRKGRSETGEACEDCLVYTEITLRRRSEWKDEVVVRTTWNLGDCQDPFGNKWRRAIRL